METGGGQKVLWIAWVRPSMMFPEESPRRHSFRCSFSSPSLRRGNELGSCSYVGVAGFIYFHLIVYSFDTGELGTNRAV